MNSAVIEPITSTKFSAVSDSSNSGDMRATMKMPAVTMVAAWISAEIGVGPSIESGSHTCSGTCALLPIAPMNRQMQITVISIHSPPPGGVRESDLRQLGRLGEGFGVVQRAGVGDDEADAQDEAEVADPVHQEGLHVGEDRGRLLEPEADQQVAHQAHRFPAEEQLQEVVAHHQHQHAEGEQRDVGEEALVARVLFHVADGVDVHHQRHEGDDAHHHRGQAVDQEADFHLQAADDDPFVDGGVEARAVHGHRLQHHGRADEGDQHAQDGDDVRAAAAHGLAGQAGDQRTDQRRQRQWSSRRFCDRVAAMAQPFSSSSSSTLIDARLRNSTTRIARPMADSAAATVRMKNTNTCPAMSPR